MCMDVQTSSKMGENNDTDDDIQIISTNKEKAVTNKVPVKQERPDEAEIRELAAKMVEANKAKMGTAGNQAGNLLATQRPQNCNTNLSGLLGYLNPTKRPSAQDVNIGKSSPENKSAVDDEESLRGRFGWTTFSDTHIPYIFRASEKYCAVRILESKLLNKYLSYLHSDIYSCTCIRSYYISEVESKLLTEINSKHCDYQFGREQFTTKDLVVRLADAKEFYTFLDVCYSKLTSGNQNLVSGHRPDKCGFIRINKESVVPYTVKGGLKYVPLFYFEGETENLKLKAEKLEGWDLSYLKFCCKVQGIRNELFASETCSVISLNDIKSYFPPGTGFEDYWPSKVMDSQLLVTCKGSGSGGGWTKQPPAPPVTKSHNNVSKNSINARGASLQNMLPRNSIQSGTTLQRINQRPVVTTHPVHSVSSAVPSSRNSQISQSLQNPINGWAAGLVGGQPTYPTSNMVSQQNSIIRMAPSSLSMHNQMSSVSKNYNNPPSRSRGTPNTTQPYPSYPTTNMQAGVPPLIRTTMHSNQSNLGISTTYTTSSLGNSMSASTYPQMLGLGSEHVQSMMPSQTSASLMHSTQRHTPPNLNTGLPAHSASNTAHSNHSKYPPPPLLPVNGSSNNTRDSRGRKALIPIADNNQQLSQVQPYQVQKALVEEKLVPCINFKPYIYTELLMTLPDFVMQYFPNCDIESCRHILTNVLGIDLYQGNRLQMEMLLKNGKCSSLSEELPLIQVRNIMKFMPQLKYMLNNRNASMVIPSNPQPAHSQPVSTPTSPDEQPPKKRQHLS